MTRLSARLALIAVATLSACATPPAMVAEALPIYEVHAVRYATLVGYPTRWLVQGADSSRTTDGAMMVWLLRGGDRTVLVDAGFYRDAFVQGYDFEGYRRPTEALAALGVTPESVTDVVVTHVHWDHVGGADLFPNARVWIQRDEFDHHVGPDGEALDEAIAPVHAAMLARLRSEGRVRLVEGDDQEILPGIRAYTGGRHTHASQYVGVRTRSGTVVVASDNVYLYENLDRHVPIGATLDAEANLAAQDRMRTLAAEERLIVPGHDAAVFERFATLGADVARID